MDNKSKFIIVFKSCLDLLRTHGITGERALRNISYLLTLKLLEPIIVDQIKIDDFEYDFSHIEDEYVDQHRTKLLSIARFSNLAKEKESNIPKNIQFLWDDILSVHPLTKNIFSKGKGFDIQSDASFKTLIVTLDKVDFMDADHDVLGDAYEEVVKDIMVGRVLGQYFTPPTVKKLMVRLINPKLFPDGTIGTCADPAMGTGGFLITYLHDILKQAKEKGIELDWSFIKEKGFYGKEIDPDTYQLAMSNMLISSGHIFDQFEKGDSIREPIMRKFDNVLANPPFGIKGLKYDEISIESGLKSEYIPIKTNNAVSLFVQAIVYMLKIKGKCAVVLPDGQELHNKTNKTFVILREYLMKTCDLKKVIYLPVGVFTNTTIKTCILFFRKKVEGSDVIKISIDKRKSKPGRTYTITGGLQTSNVQFFDFDVVKDETTLLIEVPIEDIAKNKYSLNHIEYMNHSNSPQYDASVCEVAKLGDVCEINYGTRIVRKDNTEGEYPVYGSGRPMFTTQTYNREGFNVLIGRFALSQECVRIINQKIFLIDSGLTIKPKIDSLMHKYLAYFLLENQKMIYGCARGTAQKNLGMDEFKQLSIPIPSLEVQQDFINRLESIYEHIKQLENNIKQLENDIKLCRDQAETLLPNILNPAR